MRTLFDLGNFFNYLIGWKAIGTRYLKAIFNYKYSYTVYLYENFKLQVV